MPQLIEIVEDLSWLGKIWQHEGEPAVPYALEATLNQQTTPALALIGDDGVIIHRGRSVLVQMSTKDTRAWLKEFLSRSCTKLRDVRLEALRKWGDVSTDDGPCLACGAQGVTFDGATPRFCPHCTLGKVRKPVWGRIGAELVNLRAILGPLAYLRGDSAAFGLFDDNAPMLWTDEWMMVVEPGDTTPEQVTALAFD
jgi:hypothetical protein